MTSNDSDSSGKPNASIAQIRVLADRPRRVFAIGDVHGCASELQALLSFLTGSEGLSDEDQVVFLGDYVDRGPASNEVISTLIAFRERFPRTVFLKGNHEDMLLDFLGFGGYLGYNYLPNGGEAFLGSYKIPVNASLEEILAKLPSSHIDFLANLELGVLLAEFLFVHAGINPFNALDKQTTHDLMWIRRDFTTFEHNLGKTVVFGHTPYEDILLHLPFKIGIDTGLVYGNKLTAVELVQGAFYQVDRGETTIKQGSLRERLDSRPR